MDNFENIDIILARLLSGEILTLEEQKIVDDWLSKDGKNRDLLERMEQYWQITVTPRIGNDQKKAYSIFKAKKRREFFRVRILSRSIAACAVLTLGITLGLVINSSFKDKPSLSEETLFDPDSSYLIVSDGTIHHLSAEETPELLYMIPDIERENDRLNELIVGRRQIKTISMPDRSVATVNANSRLSFPTVFSADERRVKLNGEAYFDVVSDDRQPFIIETKDCEIAVKGTILNVRSYQDESSEITVVTGHVEVSSPVAPSVIELRPGERLEIEGGSISKTVVDPEYSTAWQEGIFYFDQTQMSEVARQLSRWYGIDIGFANREKQTITFSGIIDRNNPLNELLASIENLKPVVFKKTDHGYIIE